jgi:hypothetical protein
MNKAMKSFYLLLITLAISATSCRTKEGEPGPAGKSSLTKQGSVSGTITYSIDNGTTNTATVPFEYNYFESLNDNKFYFEDSEGDYYDFFFGRKDLKDARNYFYFWSYGYGTNGIEDDPEYTNVNFSFVTVINNKLLEFNTSGGDITNLKLDPETGRLTFDYANDSVEFNEGTASIAVKVDVILNRSSNYVLNL